MNTQALRPLLYLLEHLELRIRMILDLDVPEIYTSHVSAFSANSLNIPGSTNILNPL